MLISTTISGLLPKAEKHRMLVDIANISDKKKLEMLMFYRK
jgi:hypothetical protein